MKWIDGVEIIPVMEPSENFFSITIKNNSKEPLYIYRAYFKPGHFSTKVDRSSVSTFTFTLLFKTWVDNKMPRFYEPRNTNGAYLLTGDKKEIAGADSVFLEPREDASFALGFDENDLTFSKDKTIWYEIIKKKECGILQFHFVHGPTAGVFEAQL